MYKKREDRLKAAHAEEIEEMQKRLAHWSRRVQQMSEEHQKELERKHPWMFTNAEQLSIENKKDHLALPSIEQQCANSCSKAIEYSNDPYTR